MRRIVSLLVVACVVLFTVSAIAADKPGKGMYFRLITHGDSGPFWVVVQKGIMDAVDELGCQVDIDLARGNLALMQQQFQEAVAMQPDGIALAIVNDNAFDEAVADAVTNGINVIGINNDDTQGAAGNARLAYIGQNERRAGYVIARRLFEAGRAKGWDLTNAKVAAAVEDVWANYGVVRSAGIKDAMAEFGVATELEIVDTGGAAWAEQSQTTYLEANPDTKFFFGLGGICTDRLAASLKNAGKNPGDVLAGGFDATPGTLEGLKSGYVEASIDQQQYLQGYLAIYTLYLMKKYGFAPQIDTGGYVIDKSNIALIEQLSPMKIR
jgi:simple sugar transport system substrate-binding protein